MATGRIPQRLAWVVDTLAVDPGQHVLEIGCGRGAAVSLICERLTDGSITAVDRSAVAIRAAEQANVDHVRSGTARFLQAELAAVELGRERFNTVFAVNVNLFWVRNATRELAIVQRLLAPAGALHLFYGYGKASAERSDDVIDRLAARLSEGGYAVDGIVAPGQDSLHMLYVRARPRLA